MKPPVDTNLITFRITMEIYVVSFLCVFGISSNLVSIVVLGRDRVVRRTTGFLLQVLAFTDIIYLVTCLFYQTIRAVNTATDWMPSLRHTWPYMEPYVWPCASIAQTCTVWLVVVVTADRYVAICKPLHAPQYSTMTRMRRVVILVWCVSIVYNLPRFFERTVRLKVTYENVTLPYTGKTPLWNNTWYKLIYKTMLFFILRFFLPLTSLAFFNTRLIQAIKDSYRRRREMPGEYHNHRKERYSLTLVVVVVVFIICETPDFFLRAWSSLSTWSNVPFPKPQLMYVNIISNIFLTINSCSNFVIYCFIGTRFRKILIHILRRRRRTDDGQTFRISSQWGRPEEMTILVSHWQTDGGLRPPPSPFGRTPGSPYRFPHSPYRYPPSPYRYPGSPCRSPCTPYRQPPSPYSPMPSPCRAPSSPYRHASSPYRLNAADLRNANSTNSSNHLQPLAPPPLHASNSRLRIWYV